MTCKAPIKEPLADDIDITCMAEKSLVCPSSHTKDAVTQTCITIEHLTYSNENLMNPQGMRKYLFLSKVVQNSLHYTGVLISLSVAILKFTYKCTHKPSKNLTIFLY